MRKSPARAPLLFAAVIGLSCAAMAQNNQSGEAPRQPSAAAPGASAPAASGASAPGAVVGAAQEAGAPEISPLSMLAIMSPVASGEAVLIPGSPEQIFPKLIDPAKNQTAPISEADWLKSHKIKALPPQRDPVITEDYARPPVGPAFTYRLDRLTDGFTGAQNIKISEGRAEAKYVMPGPYCLVLRTNPPQTTYFTAGGPVTIVRPDSWAPLASQLYVCNLKTLDAQSFWTLLSPAVFSQIHPLVERLRSKASIQTTELFLFYRGYFEGLALARWLENSPEGRLRLFLQSLRSTDAYVDKVVTEALAHESLSKAPAGFAGAFKPQSGSSAAAASAEPTPTPAASNAGAASSSEAPAPGLSLARYKSFYHAGMAAFFSLESTQKTIPGGEGEFFHPDLSALYEEQYHHFATVCLNYAKQSDGSNPLISALDTYLQEQAPQTLNSGGSPNAR